ncbi:uncharacterized protein [Blastocystis hominis]|uniref:Kinesin motor domain-containing protein n=1 Tax=Blastocystis hominis TaxID=12968 RepID=D8LV40_BLAHO|nr:uncharacterized protein [Blastocystis hominis]CBK19679.2 unnamed protein product [Blastocystis hominis]|eukprot:XP_012893727.1 uncharacterized protein [Blastocystis hominis]
MEARYQNQIAKLTQSLQQHDMERLKMEEERKEKEKELELLREEVEGLKREREELKRESEGFKEEMGEKEEQLIQMKHEIEEWREKADRLNVELKGKSERNEGIEELDRMKTENESLKTELNEMKKENESLKGELKNVQMENEREELNQCIEELERVKQENESLRAELERGKEGVAMAETIALKEELDNLNKVNASLREELIKLSAERKNLLNPLLSHQLPRGYQIDLNEFNEFNDQQSLEGEPDFRTHPPEQFFYSSPLPTSSSSLEAYRLVISQLYREVLSLQRENQSLVAQLDAAKPLQITITPSGMEESNAGVKSLIASMQMTMQTLQVTLKEKNDLIAKLNAQLQQFLSDSHPNGEFSLDQREVETENMLNSEEQTESEGEEEQSQQSQHKEEEDQRDHEDQEDQKDQEEEEEEEEEEKGASPKQDFSQEMQMAREEAERMRQSCEQLMEENNAKEKLLEAQRSREQQLSDEVASLQNQVSALEEKREELQTLLSLSRQNIQQLSTLFKGQLGQLRDSLSSLPPLLTAQQTSLRGEMETTIRTIAAKYAFLTNHLLSSRQLISSLRDEIQNYKGNYRVMIRVRPINNTDTSTHSCIRITDEYNISIQSEDTRNEPKSFVFDRILPPAASQEELFLEIEPAVLSVFRGINSTILAYGQTGSGKTYSMVGEKGRLGLTFRSCHLLFEEFRYRADTSYELKISISEIYCETLRDLLAEGRKVSVPFSAKDRLVEVAFFSVSPCR